MHRANAAAVDALYPGCHLIMNVTGFEHRSGLIFPVHRPQPAFDSALAVPKNFGVISFHSKGPFVELFSVMTNSFQPTFTGLSSFFFKTDQKITLVDGLGYHSPDAQVRQAQVMICPAYVADLASAINLTNRVVYVRTVPTHAGLTNPPIDPFGYPNPAAAPCKMSLIQAQRPLSEVFLMIDADQVAFYTAGWVAQLP